MRRILFVLTVLVVVLGLVACVSGPEPAATQPPKPKDTPAPTAPPPPPPQIIEHKTSDFGGSVPEWVTKTALELEQDDEFSDYYVFIEDHPGGKDLQGLKIWAKNFSAASSIAAMVSNRVKSKFVGAAAGDANMLETYMEQVVKTVSEAEFSGMRINDEFWVKKRYFLDDGSVEKEEYRYLFLITVPRKAINDAIKRAFDEAVPETAEERSAMDRVKDAWGDDL